VQDRGTNWLSDVRKLLNGPVFSEVWIFWDSVINPPYFVNQLTLRLTDLNITEWRKCVSKSTSLTLYKELQDNFELFPYLRKLDLFKHRQCLSKLRLSSHVLNIEQGKHRNIPRNMRKCTLCNNDEIKDEYHFVLIRNAYTELRHSYIHSFFTRPSMYKCVKLYYNYLTMYLNL